ncbi:hypothetical protein PTKIN_Ptkin03bG0189200 [Pterospermum kingtungense]
MDLSSSTSSSSSSSRRSGAKSSVVAGSVWETRMKSDEVKGGIKVFNGGEAEENSSNAEDKRLSLKKGQGVGGGVGVSGKRKTWKSESFDGFEKNNNPIQIPKSKAEDHCKELSVSVDGVKKSPIRVARGRSVEHCKDLSLSVDGVNRKTPPGQVKKGRSEGVRELSKSVDGIERSPIHMKKPRSEVPKRSSESGERVERNSVQLRKAKSDSVKASNQSGNGNGNGNEANLQQLRRSKSEENKVLVLDDQKMENNVASIEENEKNPVESTDKNGSDESEENCKEFGVCQEKVISSNTSNGDIAKSSPEVLSVDDDGDGDGDGVEDDEELYEEEEEEEEEEVLEEEIEVGNEQNKSFDIKEMNVPQEKPNKVVVNEVKKLPAEEKPNKAVYEVKKLQEDEPTKVVNEVKKTSKFHNKSAPFSSTVNKHPPPVVKRATSIYTTPTNPTKSTSFSASGDYSYQSFPQTQNNLQNLVDLVMWRDVPKSTLVFGMGTFMIISSSYTQDLNISCISVISYLGLVYLAAIFLYRSIICRGVVDIDESSCVVGEGEAVWLLKLVLPYLNEFLLKLRALFSGDPATTMKLAVLLFVLARCGTFITIWKMAKLGKFWVRRFRDAWESCTHKKAVAVAIFTLVWNLSSIVARIWAAFMLFVAFRYYQQKMVTDGWVEDEAGPDTGETWQEPMGRQRHGLGSSRVEPVKVKKGS